MNKKLNPAKKTIRKKVVKKVKEKKQNRTFIWIGLSTIALFFVLWSMLQITRFGTHAAATGWVDNSRDLFKTSTWFTSHAYGDCQTTSGVYWPGTRLDCIFSEPAVGPSATDKNIVQDPPGLYYKHLLPTDWFSQVPGLITSIDFSNLTTASLEAELSNAVSQNPQAYANLSVSSVDIGLEGGNTGTIIRSMSIYVHPSIERPISNAIGVLQRATNIYKPFIEGASGAQISDTDLTDLYLAALNSCGTRAINNDQSGQGVFKKVGGSTVVVQNWYPENTPGIGFHDCNIHVVISATASATPSPSSIPNPTPSGVEPTFVCGGSTDSVCLTQTPAPTQVPSVTVIPTLTLTPTNPIGTPIPTFLPGESPTPTTFATPVPKPGGNNQSFIQLLINFILLILNFLIQLFGGGKVH